MHPPFSSSAGATSLFGVACLLAPALAQVPLLGSPPPRLRELPVELAPALESTTSEALIEAPETLLGRRLRIDVQLHSLVEDWNPYLTSFTPADYVALVAWADEQLPWLRVDYEHPALVLFVPRGGSLERRLRGWQRHDRLGLTIQVDELLMGRGWTRVLDAYKSPELIPEGTVLHVIEARKLIRNEAYAMALDALDRALAAPLPSLPRQKLEELQGWCRERLAEQ